MQTICVFCGSSPGSQPEYLLMARQLGQILAERKITLVFGGSKVGIMGEIAKTVLNNGGEVIGVIPEKLVKMEVAYEGLTQLHVVNSMHERKAMMAELSDGFIALPGGLGTIEEFFEVLTWNQLGMQNKPCGLLNICGYYDKLLEFVDVAVDQLFVEGCYRDMILVDQVPETLLEKMSAYQPPNADKAAWVLEMTRKANER